MKGGNIRESIPGVSRFRTDEPEGESCVFAMLGMCGGRMAAYPNLSRRSEQLSCKSFSIRVTVYFILILKDLNHFRINLNILIQHYQKKCLLTSS